MRASCRLFFFFTSDWSSVITGQEAKGPLLEERLLGPFTLSLRLRYLIPDVSLRAKQSPVVLFSLHLGTMFKGAACSCSQLVSATSILIRFPGAVALGTENI